MFTPDQIQYLHSQGYSSGMVQALASQKDMFPNRFWILDNSSAMNVRDAHILRNNYQNIDNVTRWEELLDCLIYHADFITRFHLPTRYSLLNNPMIVPQYFSLAQTGNIQQEQQTLQQVMTYTKPNGPTPLSNQLQILRQHIVTIAPQLHANKQTVSIIVTTQGMPTNERGETSNPIVEEFIHVLRSFEEFSSCVWFVFRMCTDDENTVDFYNTLDSRLSTLPCDVLDDYYSEALEVYLRNPWLTYGLVLHRYREMGFKISVLDAIDERALTRNEVRDLCYFLFAIPTLPDPNINWNHFIQALQHCLSRERQHYNPITKTVMPWLNLAHLNAVYGSMQQQQQQPIPQQVPMHQQPFPTNQPYSTANTSNVSQQQQQQQQQQTSSTQQPQTSTATATTPVVSTEIALTTAIEKSWAKQPPTYTTIKPIHELLGTIGNTFVLVEPVHDYFKEKFHPFSTQALTNPNNNDVLKRAVRKMRLFLHPDKLPKDLNDQQKILCRTLWDLISESWNAHNEKLGT